MDLNEDRAKRCCSVHHHMQLSANDPIASHTNFILPGPEKACVVCGVWAKASRPGEPMPCVSGQDFRLLEKA